MAQRVWPLMVSVMALHCYSTLVAATPQGDALIQVAKDWKSSFPSWVPGTDPCKTPWERVTCDATGSSIIGLNLTNSNLQGPVPTVIGNLTDLTVLDVSNVKYNLENLNAITGNLSALAPLQNLQLLNLSTNVLGVSKFPEVVYNLTKLRYLIHDNTMVTGPFPVEVTKLKSLQKLYLGNNSFTGPIPSELGNLTNLVELTIWGSSYNCALPPEIGRLVNLTYLNCNRCSLWGGLPPEYGNLKNLQRMHLYKNALTGPIPTEYKVLTNLQEIRFETNALFGSVDSWLIGLPNLKLLSLNFNQLYRSLPYIINRTTTNLTSLYLSCNYFTGKYPIVDPNIISQLDANCYDNPGVNGTIDIQCGRQLSCLPFQAALNANGGCPPCPQDQYRANQTSCICFGGGISGSSKKSSLTAVIGAVVAVVIALSLIAFLLFCLWRRRRSKFDPKHDYFHKGRDGEQEGHWEVPKGVQRFTLEDLARATQDFSKDHEIGSGSFGKVFVGSFPSSKSLAIKRASTSTSDNGQMEFRNEVLLLSRLHHKNLVRLEGFCDENNLQILVYEYMKNGNLHHHLFAKNAGKYLDWYKRLEIAVHIAQGLDYLHSFADPPVIHRDVKPSNILLDDNLVAKVADFGISKESPELHTHISTRPAGTAGYFDPQYFITRQLTTASDVYSYGVVLLELLTGQKAIDHSSRGEEYNLIEWVKPRLREGGIDLIVDPKLEGNYHRETYRAMADLALRCCDFEKKERPSMKEVVAVLEPLLREAVPPETTATDPWPGALWIRDAAGQPGTPGAYSTEGSIFTNSTTGSSSHRDSFTQSRTATTNITAKSTYLSAR